MIFEINRKNKVSMINLTAYIFNIITSARSIFLSPLKPIITKQQTVGIQNNENLVDRPTMNEKRKLLIGIRFKKGTLDENSIHYARGDIKWQKYNFMKNENKINILNTIYEKEGLWVVECSIKNTCGVFCMKLRTSFSEYENESKKFTEMLDSPIQKCFPDVFAFIKIKIVNCSDKDSVWYGICMEKMSHTVSGLIFPGKKTTHESVLKKLNLRFFKEVQTGTPIYSDNDYNILGGVILKKESSLQTFQTSLIVACIRLLAKLHSVGFVHGDTHLGNFVFNENTWRVYVIDVERSFRSKDPIQHFLDIQELFGHASGLIISKSNPLKWDFEDILGVACKLHPSISRDTFNLRSRDNELRKRSAFSMLPICHCFSRSTSTERRLGCTYCQSEVNRATYLDFYNHSDEYIKSFVNMSLKMIKHCTKVVRENSDAQRTAALYTLLSPECSKTISPLLIEQEGIYISKINTDEQVQIEFNEWVDNLLYGGAFNYEGKIKTNIWLSVLKYHGHHAAVAAILECCYKHVNINENIDELNQLVLLENENLKKRNDAIQGLQQLITL